jgi:hypothetical protein
MSGQDVSLESGHTSSLPLFYSHLVFLLLKEKFFMKALEIGRHTENLYNYQ